MKKVLLLLTVLFSAATLSFADAKNIVYKESFSFAQIENLKISLTYEDLQISQIYGDEIVVEIGSNNRNKTPEVFVDDDILKIQTKEQKVRRGERCNVYVYLPQDFFAKSIELNNTSGNITVDILKAENAILVNNVSGRTDIGNCQTELFTSTNVSGNSTLQKIVAEYFQLSSTSGNLFAQLEQAPEATSQLTNISGKTQLYYPKDSNFEIVAFTITGNIKTDSQTQKNAGSNYQTTIGTGGAQVSITSVSGKIEMVGY